MSLLYNLFPFDKTPKILLCASGNQEPCPGSGCAYLGQQKAGGGGWRQSGIDIL